MASITIRNITDDVKEALRQRAALHGVSLEQEVRNLLASTASGETLPIPTSDEENTRTKSLHGAKILLIIGGGIAAYKTPDLIRRLRERGANVRVVMTEAAQKFITPLAIGAVTADRVYADLFSRDEEQDVGHIRLARDADLIVVAPATADLMAKMAHGLADDLASAVLLARKIPVVIAPAMNPAMWDNAATRRNREMLAADGVRFVGPDSGEMAERGELGVGRMSDVHTIVSVVSNALMGRQSPLKGRKVIVTSGPTYEALDPVRFVGNRSSGKQGHAIAAAFAALGAEVHLISGPVSIPNPEGVKVTHVESAEQMLEAVQASLPADVAVMAAAVADWQAVNVAPMKMKKEPGQDRMNIEFKRNPDILSTVGHAENRPILVVGFAAETNDLIANAQIKLTNKKADIIVANDVSVAGENSGAFGKESNKVYLISRNGVEDWPSLSKAEVADRIALRVSATLEAIFRPQAETNDPGLDD
ncbi:bifunctional phosphopantothenoylcysteine decarboxylase/phosphopantothenate--cysteine ligase CoaBC [Ochrobactrum sp. WV_118_8]